MAITRTKKEELVELYKGQIERSSAIVFTDYRGTSVPKIQNLRTKLSEFDTVFMVVKNSLFGIALDQSDRIRPEELLAGPKAIAFVGEDIGQGVTALKDWIKTESTVQIRGALLDNVILDEERALALADLPTREQTLAMTLAAINAPASTLVRMINAPSSSLARVINAYVEKQKEAA
ncbi:MAG: 50S ribosomal protein L10 [Caldilineaceae bacterium]|nr:50S ribosomal protein L10 [Caldilineaceae bacterium]